MSNEKFLNLILILFLFLFLSSGSYSLAAERSEAIKNAVESLSACGNFIRFDESSVYTGFGTYWTGPTQPRLPVPAHVTIVSLGSNLKSEIETQDSAIDMLTDRSGTYILTFSGIEHWNIAAKKRLASYKTHILGRPLADEEHPRAFAKYQDKLVIAHNRLGISFFDLKAKKITRSFPLVLSHRPLESVVNGIAVSGRYAFAVLDSYSVVGPNEKPAFQGLVVIDLENESVVAELDGLEAGADSVVADDRSAILSFYGIPLVKYTVASLIRAASLPNPVKRVWKFKYEGHPTGKAAIDDRYYYTCFSKMPGTGEGSLFKKIPAVLDRRALMLD